MEKKNLAKQLVELNEYYDEVIYEVMSMLEACAEHAPTRRRMKEEVEKRMKWAQKKYGNWPVGNANAQEVLEELYDMIIYKIHMKGDGGD